MQGKSIGYSKLRGITLTLLYALSAATVCQAQEEFSRGGTTTWMRFSDAPNALYHHLAAQAHVFLEQRSKAVSRLNTLDEWKAWQRSLRQTFMEVAGPLPEKTPLNSRVVRVVKREGYTVENIIFESRPNFYVTASLFLPSARKKRTRMPAVIYCSGHSEAAYRSPVYQHVILNLVAKGFIVFAFDPIGQGERLEYYDEETGKSHFKGLPQAHSYTGAQLFMTGNSLAGYMIWDGIRAVDYLMTRKEVDPERIGITGRSGGGTQSAIIAAFDDRIKAAAPENYITNFSWLFQSVGPQCAEQEFLKGVSRGIDMADLLLVRAPKPTLMVTTTRDMFPIQGSMETAAEVARAYRSYGKPGNFRMVTDNAPHASTEKNREALYAFFQKHLENPGDSSDIKTALLPVDALQVTATGQVSTALNGETTFSLNVKDVERRSEALQAARSDDRDYPASAVDAARHASGYRAPGPVATPVLTGRIERDGYTITKYFINGEGAYAIPYIMLEPQQQTKKVLLYLNPEGKAADVQPGGAMEWFVKKGFTVVAPDLVGYGEMGPGQFKGDSYIDGVSYNLWFASMMIGRSLTGIRTGDVVRLVHLLKENDSAVEIYGLAKAEMAPVLLHAAAFDRTIENVALLHPYVSYRSLVTTRYYNPKFIHSTVPGSVGAYDLPDLAASLAPGKLLIVDATDATGTATDSAIVREAIAIIQKAWQKEGAEQHFTAARPTSTEQLHDLYEDWINE